MNRNHLPAQPKDHFLLICPSCDAPHYHSRAGQNWACSNCGNLISRKDAESRRLLSPLWKTQGGRLFDLLEALPEHPGSSEAVDNELPEIALDADVLRVIEDAEKDDFS